MATQEMPLAGGGPWRESTLSTRTLSSPNVFMPHELDTTPDDHDHSRKSTLTAIPDLTTHDDHEMLDPSPSTASHLPTTQLNSRILLPPTVRSSPLYRLPRELRLTIFRHLLCSPLGINFPAPTIDRGLNPSLLRLNRIVSAEATALLYGGNKLIFSHPSDANVFRHALADGHAAAAFTSALILRIKNTDARLWTAYFNSLAPERSLVRDFPALRTLYVRFRGPRYLPHFGPEQNVMNWLRDAKLVEIVPAVRKCVDEVMVEICVKVPEEWDGRAWDAVTERMGRDEMAGTEVRRKGEYTALMGVWVKLETEGT